MLRSRKPGSTCKVYVSRCPLAGLKHVSRVLGKQYPDFASHWMVVVLEHTGNATVLDFIPNDLSPFGSIKLLGGQSVEGAKS